MFDHDSNVWILKYFCSFLFSQSIIKFTETVHFFQLSKTYRADENTNELLLHFMFESSLKCKQYTDLSHTISFLLGHSSRVSLPLILWHYLHSGILYSFNRNSTHAVYFIIAYFEISALSVHGQPQHIRRDDW